MDNHSRLVSAAIDVYGCEYVVSHQQIHQLSEEYDPDSDATSKSKVIPLPQAIYSYSRDGNNSWKDLGQIKPLGNDGRRGTQQEDASQHASTQDTLRDPLFTEAVDPGPTKNKLGKKKSAWPKPTRSAPPPPASPGPSSTGSQSAHGQTSLLSGSQSHRSLTRKSMQIVSRAAEPEDMEALNHLMLNMATKDAKEKTKIPAFTRQPTN